MKLLRFLFHLLILVIIVVTALLLLLYFQFRSRATPIRANIYIDYTHLVGPIPTNWSAFAQGGEEPGRRMLQNIIPQITELAPKYIRIDHIYDAYNVVGKDASGRLFFNWSQLDQTICDIYAAGAKPFLSLGYMPPAISSDGSLISAPNNWSDWSLLVQKTIERYSGLTTSLCNGTVSGNKLAATYYEVWNEPDLEQFGKWSLYGGSKDYKVLYYYSSSGATRARNVNHFYLGGPATTSAYKNWFQVFLNYVTKNNLRLDFLSWHHYSPNPDDYLTDVTNINSWLADKSYSQYAFLSKIISEWGYDSQPNPIADTNIGAAYTIASIRNLIDQNVQMAFSFELKDGPVPSWGILTYAGAKKPRYLALQFLNLNASRRLQIDGEGTYVRAIASMRPGKVVAIFVNFDRQNSNVELVPVTITNLPNLTYKLALTYLDGTTITLDDISITNNTLKRNILMQPNMVVAMQLEQK